MDSSVLALSAMSWTVSLGMNPCLQIPRYVAQVLHRQSFHFSHRIGRLAGVAKLADALDLGSSALGVWVQVPPSAPATKKLALFKRAGFICLTLEQPVMLHLHQ